MKKHFTVVLAGNPNCGKTCIFNALTGARQHVGNYPGVTVESKAGNFSLNGKMIQLIDLPGIYSLSSSSPEEEVAFRELTRPGIDLIVNVIDSTIPQRSLYLTMQLAELGIPMLLAFNMSDDAEARGLVFDIPKFERNFGTPVARTVGNKNGGVQPLLDKLAELLEHPESGCSTPLSYGEDVDDAIRAVSEKIDALAIEKYRHLPSRFLAVKLLEHDSCALRIEELRPARETADEQLLHLRNRHAIETDTFMADRRYAMVAGACRGAITMSRERRREISDRIDVVMTSKYIGLPLFFLIIYLTFWFTFTLADPLMGYIETGFAWLSDAVKNLWPETMMPYLRSLLTDGVIGGVGGVLVFLPNILFLFFAIAILEDSGYMARAAFVMDGVMRRFGLQGRSFVPLVLGFGCTVPAIMATRCIESERDRKTTIMVLPLMSCSARLPIYALIIPAFFAPRYQPLMMWIIYLIGVAVALVAARILKSTLFRGDGEIYLMELPPYRMPTIRSLLLHMWDRGRMYVQKAGTIILFTSILLYICNTWPEKERFSRDYASEIEQLQNNPAADREQLDSQIAALENERQAERMEYTISGRIGHALEPFFRPIGFDWKLTTAGIGALAAKEVFVSQLGILYAQGETDEESIPLREQLVGNYSPLQGFCIMLFCLLSIPCLATLAIMRRELNSWKLTIAEAGGLFLLAYAVTFAVYQTATLLGIGVAPIS